MTTVGKGPGSKVIALVMIVLVACAAFCILKVESYNTTLRQLIKMETEKIVVLNTRHVMRNISFSQYQYYTGEALKEYGPAAKEYITGMVKSSSDNVSGKDNEIKSLRADANALSDQAGLLTNKAANFRKAAAMLAVAAALCMAVLIVI
jgi:hypothetical protein